MNKQAALILIAAVLLSAPAVMAEELTVRAVGILVAQKDPNSKYDQSYVFGSTPGLTVYIRVEAKGKGILKLDGAACKLTAFADDKDTDLKSKVSRGFMGRPGWIKSASVAKDKKSCLLQLHTPLMPDKGAGRISIDATLGFSLGGKTKIVEIKDVALVKATKIEGAPLPLLISEAKESKWQKGKFQVTIQSDQSLDAIKNLTFLGADGKEIKARSSGTMRMGFGGKYTFSSSYLMDKKVEKATLKFEHYTDIQPVTVPVKVSVGLGL
jgi:hypothetical protein